MEEKDSWFTVDETAVVERAENLSEGTPKTAVYL
jgi:hypothetical protein